MRVLIIGGNRFVGRHLVQKLLAGGHEVVLFNRGQHPAPVDPEVRVIHGDRKQHELLREKLAGESFDAVVDMVAYDAADVEGAVRALHGRTGRYLLVSTASVYPIGTCPVPIRETDPLVDDPQNAYGYHKVMAERTAMEAHEASGFPATIIRFPAVYGPYDPQAREWYFIRRLLDRRSQILLPDGGLSVQHRDHAANLADQMILLLKSPQTIGQIYNSGHRQLIPYRSLVKMAAEIVGQEIELYSVPAPKLPWSIPLAEPIHFLQTTERMEALGYQEHFNLREGLRDTIEYLSANPIQDWLFEARQKTNLFDYAEEDKIIAEQAVRLP